jgi:hypothetical protein
LKGNPFELKPAIGAGGEGREFRLSPQTLEAKQPFGPAAPPPHV